MFLTIAKGDSSGAAAGFALPMRVPSFRIDGGVFGSVFVALRAVCDSAMGGSRRYDSGSSGAGAAQNVDALGNRFQVGRVHAKRSAAEVIDNEAVRDTAFRQSVTNSVCQMGDIVRASFNAQPDAAIAFTVHAPSPKPAAGVGFGDAVSENPVNEWRAHVRSIA